MKSVRFYIAFFKCFFCRIYIKDFGVFFYKTCMVAMTMSNKTATHFANVAF